jgi:hypothetical protein
MTSAAPCVFPAIVSSRLLPGMGSHDVHERHRSREHILLLKELDEHYPKECTIRIILDNHSSHISKETMAYLASRPNRFIYVHTPNMVPGST